MVKVKVNDQEYYLDENLKKNLDRAIEFQKKDWDFAFIVDGKERGGKSVFAQQMAYYVDKTFNIDRVTFTAREFKKAVLKAEPGQAVIYDEAFTGLSSKDTMNRTNKLLVQMLAEVGQKNLFIFVVMPTFFDLTKYVALHRSRALIHIYTGDNFERGYFAFYNEDLKKKLYIDGKDYYDYKGKPYNFVGRFVNHYVIDEKVYRQKKRQSLAVKDEDEDDARDDEDRLKMHKAWLFEYLQRFPDMTQASRMKLLEMPQSTYQWKLKKLKSMVARKESEAESV